VSPPSRQADLTLILAQAETLTDVRWHRGCAAWLRHDLSLAQLRVMMTLHHRAAQPMSRLAESVGVGVSALSTLVDRLEQRQLVARSRDDIDRRVVTVSLTPAGDRLADEATGMQREQLRHLLERLTTAELGGLALGLSGLRRALALESGEGAARPGTG